MRTTLLGAVAVAALGSVGCGATPATFVKSDTTLTDAARMMRDADIGDVIVVDRMKPIGVLTDRDIVVRGIADNRTPSMVTAGEICSTDLVSVAPDAEISQAIALMRRAAVRRLPVTQAGELIGVLSLGEWFPQGQHAAADPRPRLENDHLVTGGLDPLPGYEP